MHIYIHEINKERAHGFDNIFFYFIMSFACVLCAFVYGTVSVSLSMYVSVSVSVSLCICACVCLCVECVCVLQRAKAK